MEKIIENKLLGESIHYRKLKNGLRVYILPKPGYSKQFAIYGTQYGSNDSQFVPLGQNEAVTVPDGIAHFLEHKLFEEEHGNVFEEYSRLGTQPNAFTNFNMTAYHFTSTGNFHESLDVLMGFVGRPFFTDENVEKEKGIIAQEIRMYEDNPYWRVYFNLLRTMYHSYPVRKDIAGTVESIYKIDKETLYMCYETFYHPSNMTLFISGDIDLERTMKQIEDHFKGISYKGVPKDIERIFSHEPKEVHEKTSLEKLAVSMPMFALGFKDSEPTEGGEKLLKKLIANDIILDMLAGPSSEVYNRLYEEGLIDESFSTDYTGERNYGYAILSGQSKDPEKVADILYDEIALRKAQGWDIEYFDRIKKKKTGQFIRMFNNIEITGVEFVSMLFKGINLFDYLEGIEAMTSEDIKDEFSQLYSRDNSSLSLIMPI